MMKRTIVAVLALSFATAACAHAPASRSRAQVLQTTPVTVFLDAPRNSESFTTPVDNLPGLTADQAIAAYQAVNSELVVPPDATIQLGLYTASVGDGTYRYNNQLAWAVSWHLCAVSAHELPADTALPCTYWLFLDANSGEMLEGEWQLGS